MSDFEFPKNVKQIGSITGSLKIYMEDYVCSYLQQYAASGGYSEKLAVLIGRQIVIDSQKILFINGAIQAKYTRQEGNIEVFTNETWDYVYEQISTYFGETEILGWMQSQPGYGVYLNINYAKYHFEVFRESHQVMFVTDPLERSSVFFTAGLGDDELTESKGYFIYYDKNKSMHEYMLNTKADMVEIASDADDPEYDCEEDVADESFHTASRKLFAKPPRSTSAKTAENKRMVNMLVSLSALLLVICFIMGVGLIQNEDRITRLERSLAEVTTVYSSAIEQLRNGRSEDVFAARQEEEQKPDLMSMVSPIDPNRESVISEETDDESLSQTSEAEPMDIPETYTVQIGDNLIYISNYFYGTSDMIDAIMELNEINDPDKINFGEEIKLPRSGVN